MTPTLKPLIFLTLNLSLFVYQLTYSYNLHLHYAAIIDMNANILNQSINIICLFIL